MTETKPMRRPLRMRATRALAASALGLAALALAAAEARAKAPSVFGIWRGDDARIKIERCPAPDAHLVCGRIVEMKRHGKLVDMATAPNPCHGKPNGGPALLKDVWVLHGFKPGANETQLHDGSVLNIGDSRFLSTHCSTATSVSIRTRANGTLVFGMHIGFFWEGDVQWIRE